MCRTGGGESCIAVTLIAQAVERVLKRLPSLGKGDDEQSQREEGLQPGVQAALEIGGCGAGHGAILRHAA
jgi:hypothetical protein